MARFSWPTQWRFRNRILLMLGLFAYAFAGPYFAPLWEMSDFAPWLTITVGVIGTAGSVLCWSLLLIWLLGFSYVPFKIRMVLFAFFLVYLAMIDDIQLDSLRQPVLHYRWQSRPADALAEYLESQVPEAAQGPAIDLRIDPVNDFPRFRGFHGDGIATPTELLDLKWANQKPREKWHHPCGAGFSAFAVAGNVAITLEQRKGKETIVCYDRETGVQRWAHSYTASFRHITGHGPRATPTIAEGMVYSLGALGHLVCLDGATGEARWARNILEDARATPVSWGVTSSPLIVDGLVIVNAGIDPEKNAGRAVLAYRAKDGTIAWASGDHAAGYSSPLLATLAGKQQVVLFDNDGVAGYDPGDGAVLWRFPWQSTTDGNVTQPLFLEGDRVFISSETNRGCAMLRVYRTDAGFAVDEVWANQYLCTRYANPVHLGPSIFGLSSGYPVCLDVETGKRNWRGRKCYKNGQLLGVAGHLLIQTEDGEILVVPADARKLTIAARVKVFDRRTWNTPALAGRCLYLRNEAEMACLELPLNKR